MNETSRIVSDGWHPIESFSSGNYSKTDTFYVELSDGSVHGHVNFLKGKFICKRRNYVFTDAVFWKEHYVNAD